MTHERALEIARSGNFSCIADMIQFAAQEQAEADAQVCDTQRLVLERAANRVNASLPGWSELREARNAVIHCAAKIREGASK